MANKTLTAKVDFNIKSAEAKLQRLNKLINGINKAVNTKNGKSGLEKSTEKAILQQEKLKQATLKTQLAEEKLTAQKHKTALAAQRVKNATDSAANSAKKLSSAYRSSNSSASGLLSTVKQLAATYLGVMGMKAVIGTSDTITSAENRLNNLAGGSPELTQATMDKVYAASQRSRSGYGDMLGNVSKSMTLAGDAFQGNVDNAIRFQEIMSKAYTVGGASAAEQASSMYQLVQALGSGVLQGDELRSVREGAPLAYKAIEEFCQGVLNTDESLKDLASQGVITSNMVVAAVMDMENGANNINDKFEKTSMTFAQSWAQIKNTAMKAFEPVLQRLNKFLNSDRGKKAIDGICNALLVLADVADWLITVFEAVFSWCADNWGWLKYVILGIIIVIIAAFIMMKWEAIKTAVATAAAWIGANWGLLLIVAALMAILYCFELLKQGAITMTDFLCWCALIIAVAFLIAGIIMGSIPMLIIAAVLALLVIVFYFFEEVCYGAAWLAAWIVNIVLFIVNCIITYVYVFLTYYWNIIALVVNSIMVVVMIIATLVQWVVAFVVNLGMGLYNSIKAIAENIGIAFQNAWIWAKNTFWEFVADVLRGVSQLEPVINGIAELLGVEGVDFGGLIDNIEGKKSDYKSYVSVGDAWSSGWNTMDYANMGEMISTGWNTMEFASFGDAVDSGMSTFSYVDANEWGSAAGNWGAGVKNSVNEWGSQFQNQDSALGLGTNGLLDPYDSTYGVGGSYDPSGANDDINKALDKIGDDIGDIKSSMNLTEEDISYLRKLADAEWKKEFTTANITVDMSNYNTISGESDLDGIVTKLSDKLYEEMRVVAEGVYN